MVVRAGHFSSRGESRDPGSARTNEKFLHTSGDTTPQTENRAGRRRRRRSFHQVHTSFYTPQSPFLWGTDDDHGPRTMKRSGMPAKVIVVYGHFVLLL